jgi:hypothetical protein
MGLAVMTSEKHFALSHTGFWNTLLPLEESYVRTHNLALERFATPLKASDAPDQHGIINEAAFRVFSAVCLSGQRPAELSVAGVAECAAEAYQHIRRLRQFSRTPIRPISDRGKREAIELATRLTDFFTADGRGRPQRALASRIVSLRPRPVFPGCGWVDEAEGDILADNTLGEVKAGDRLFRGTDLRQILVYAALNFSAKTYQIDAFALINPRLGVFFEDDLETLAQKTSGASASQILGEIVHYISEPIGQYRMG